MRAKRGAIFDKKSSKKIKKVEENTKGQTKKAPFIGPKSFR